MRCSAQSLTGRDAYNVHGPLGPAGNQLSGLLSTMSNPKRTTQPRPVLLPHLVSASVIAEHTGWTCKHIYDLAARCLIPHYRINGSIRFDPVKIAIWLAEHEILIAA